MGKNKLNAASKEKVVHHQLAKSEKSLESFSEVDQTCEDTSTSAYLWLLVFSVLMFTFPFLTFYGVHSWLDESFEFSTFQTNCFSVLASVIVVNFIICLYVYKAFNEDKATTMKPAFIPVAKQDKKHD